EHVADSEGLLAMASRRLRPGGTLVLSVPNVQYWPVLKGLLEGHWTYTEAGVLDRTHLRFFTRESLIRLIHGAGLEITGAALQHDLLAEAPPPDLFEALRGMGLTVAALERDATVAQFIVACRRS
ncbi:MAG: class I SAM-dependent methyltransferase, partial [Rhodospirillales bacterium]|nr:class I SAM-dependent methyltransferase [Rhodospirillales bacterium]